jgi:hypothetical protein
MAPTPRDHTTDRFRRRYNPLRTKAAFDHAFGEAQAQHDHQEEEVDDNSEDEFPTDPAIFTDHDNHDGTAHLRDDDSSNVEVLAADEISDPGSVTRYIIVTSEDKTACDEFVELIHNQLPELLGITS